MVSVVVPVIFHTLVVDFVGYSVELSVLRNEKRGRGKLTATAFGTTNRFVLVDREEDSIVRINGESSAAENSSVVERKDGNGIHESSHTDNFEGFNAEGVLSLEFHQELESFESGSLI